MSSTLLFSPAFTAAAHLILFCNSQEKASGGLPIECSREKSQDEGDEEDKKPSSDQDEDEDEDAGTEEEEDEFDSGDEAILTKSGW